MTAEETSWHSYPKVYALGHPVLADLFKDDVIVEEKVDGSQFSFGRFDDEIKLRSKGVEFSADDPEDMFKEAAEVVKSLREKLVYGWTYRAEYLKTPKHNTLCYSRIPEKHLIIFDINTGYERYLDYHEKKMACHGLGLEFVPLIFQGKVESLERFRTILDRESCLGGQKIEGVVIKNYARFAKDGKALMGKHVCEGFREKNGVEWAKSNPTRTDTIQLLCSKYASPARWQKAVFRLRDEGKLTHTPKDIGLIMAEAKSDLRVECADEIKEELFKWAFPQIQRSSTRGFPEWYKDELLKSQFNKEEK